MSESHLLPHREKPTRGQMVRDRERRAENRKNERMRMRMTGIPCNLLAASMADRGYGVDAIHERTGVDLPRIRKAVLGDEI